MDSQPLEPTSLRAAILALHESLFDPLARYLALRLGGLALAEALTIEVFLRALRGAAQRQPVGAPLEIWLLRLARQAARERQRSESQHPPVASATKPGPEAASAQADPYLPGEFGKVEAVQRLGQTLSQLDSEEQDLLALRFGARFNLEKIAHIMEIDTAMAARLQCSALRHLGNAENMGEF